MRVLSVILVAFFAFFEVVKCGHGSPWSKRHNSNVDVAAAQQNIALGKRVNGARFTFYAAGLGACGKVNSASDFVSFTMYECLSWQLNDYHEDRCYQCCSESRLILFGH